jgi:hypothetical protein
MLPLVQLIYVRRGDAAAPVHAEWFHLDKVEAVGGHQPTVLCASELVVSLRESAPWPILVHNRHPLTVEEALFSFSFASISSHYRCRKETTRLLLEDKTSQLEAIKMLLRVLLFRLRQDVFGVEQKTTTWIRSVFVECSSSIERHLII